MFGTNRSSESIYEELITKALAIAAVQEVGDSSIKRITHRPYFVTEAVHNTFINKRGNMSDGLYATINDIIEDSYNVLTNVILPISNEGEISASHTRFANNKESVFVFVNGYKIPDSSIWLYMTGSHTNIIIPKKYFNSDPLIENDILIENRKFDSYTYGGTSVKNFTGKTLSFDISSHRILTINKNTCMVFDNGVFIPNNILSVSYISGVVTIEFVNVMHNADIEVFIDSSITYTKNTSVSGTKIVPFSVDDTFVDPIYGPINSNNCMFFLNGLRISNSHVVQAGRLDFQYAPVNGPTLNNDLVTTVYTDNSVVPINDFKLYGDDYFLYNFLGSNKITEALLGNRVHDEFDKFVDYKKMLGENLTYDKVVTTIENLSKITNDVLKIQKLIETFPMLIKDFLEIFASSRIRKNVFYNGIDSNVVIGLDESYDIGTGIIRFITINGKIAKIDHFKVLANMKYWQSTVESKWFVPGDNVVDIIESIQTTDEIAYKVVDIERVETIFAPFRSYRAIIDVFGNINDMDDLRVLAITKREFDPDGIYFKGENYGFRIVNGIECPRMVFDGKIYMDFGPTDPRIDMLIVTTVKHHNVFNFTVENFDTSYDSLINELYVGIERFYDNNIYHNVKVPLIHNGTMILSTKEEGTRLFRDIDFFYRSPLDLTMDVRNSGIILKRICDGGDIVSVTVFPDYTYNTEYPSLSVEDTHDDKYGLLYLGNLKFPYSPKYVKIFANNKRMCEEDIDILSNKLIRLWKEEVSLQNVHVEANFTVSFTVLRPFIQLYSDSSFEGNIGELFACYNFFNLEGVGTVSKESADTLYESFNDGVLTNDTCKVNATSWNATVIYNKNAVVKYNENYYIAKLGNINVIPTSNSVFWILHGKHINPVRIVEYITTRYNLYLDAYLRWFISDRSNKNWNSIEDIPSEILKELSIFRNNGSGDSLDVVVFPYKEDLISNIVIATHKDWYPGFRVSDTVKNFLDCCVENGLSIQDCYSQYENFMYSNRVFKRDLVPISATQTFDGEDIVIGRGPTSKFGG